MSMQSLIDSLEVQIGNPSQGLPRDIFLLISRLTPLINVDLLLKNAKRETLLTWRADEYSGPGWHVPGGIVRFKESLASRIAAVAANEFGASVEFKSTPLATNEIMVAHRDTRGHFLSLLYECSLTSPLDATLEFKSGPIKKGEWAWHATCPQNLIPAHEIYRKFIDEK